VTISVDSLVGIAGNDELELLSSLHPQSPHSQAKASGLQQHISAVTGLDEQQLACSSSSVKLLQQDDSSPEWMESAGTFASHTQLDSELKTKGCKPIAAVANTISVASIERRIFDLLFIVLLPTQMIVGRSDLVKANNHYFKVYVKNALHVLLLLSRHCDHKNQLNPIRPNFSTEMFIPTTIGSILTSFQVCLWGRRGWFE
jgi:hypothetical protein